MAARDRNGRLLFTATKPHPCAMPRGSFALGSIWQCDTCWVLHQWQRDGSEHDGWHRIGHPEQAIILDSYGDVSALRYVHTGVIYGYVDARGNWVSVDGRPAVSPDFDHTFTWRKGNPTAEEIEKFRAAFTAREDARHSTGVPDVEVFTRNVDSIKWLRGLLAEDNDAKKTALGLIVLLVVVAAVVLTTLALTGHLQ